MLVCQKVTGMTPQVFSIAELELEHICGTKNKTKLLFSSWKKNIALFYCFMYELRNQWIAIHEYFCPDLYSDWRLLKQMKKYFRKKSRFNVLFFFRLADILWTTEYALLCAIQNGLINIYTDFWNKAQQCLHLSQALQQWRKCNLCPEVQITSIIFQKDN